MKAFPLCLACAYIALHWGASLSSAASGFGLSDRYVIRLLEGKNLDEALLSWMSEKGVIPVLSLPRFRSFAAYGKNLAIRELARHPSIEAVEEDAIYIRKPSRNPSVASASAVQASLMAAGNGQALPKYSVNPYTCPPLGFDRQQLEPWGRQALKIDAIPQPPKSEITICIIDSGYDANQPDFAGVNITSYAQQVTDKAFAAEKKYLLDPLFLKENGFTLDPSVGKPKVDAVGHGTACLGVVAAVDNSQGTVGIISNKNVHVHMVKTVELLQAGQDVVVYGSSMVYVLQECERVNAKVISLSFGSNSSRQNIENKYLKSLFSNGMLIFASAGNQGTRVNNYPASYSPVISVGALKPDLSLASFSASSTHVRYVGPGVSYLTTVPTQAGAVIAGSCSSAQAQVPGVARPFTAEALRLDSSGFGTINGLLAYCGLAKKTCRGVKGKICLVMRGRNYFSTKLANCLRGGGIAMAIINNVLDSGGYALQTSSRKIVVMLTMSDGLYLRKVVSRQKKSVEMSLTVHASNYSYEDGTSFSCPAVAGLATLLWSHFPKCTNFEILAAMDKSVLDLGKPGRDDFFGLGMPQADVAYAYLRANPCKAYRIPRPA